MGGLFLGNLNSQNLASESQKNLVQSSATTSEASSLKEINAKNKVQKRGIITVRGDVHVVYLQACKPKAELG